jgi:hypothetical protein
LENNKIIWKNKSSGDRAIVGSKVVRTVWGPVVRISIIRHNRDISDWCRKGFVLDKKGLK